MAMVFLRQSPAFSMASLSTVSVTATVVNQAAAPISRVVQAFYSSNMSASIAVVTSDPTTGAAEFSLPGTMETEFAFVVQGEVGENHVVHAHKKAD